MLLIARSEVYDLLAWVAVAPLTRTLRRIPSLVYLTPEHDGVPQPSAVNLDNILTIPKDWIDAFIVKLSPERMEAVDRAIHFALGLRN